MKLPRLRRKSPDPPVKSSADEALEQSREQWEQAREERRRLEEFAERLREMRRRNHLAEAFDHAFREGGR